MIITLPECCKNLGYVTIIEMISRQVINENAVKHPMSTRELHPQYAAIIIEALSTLAGDPRTPGTSRKERA